MEKSTVVLLDLHGEYKNAFGDYADYIDASSLELPYWLMNCEELLDLMVDRSESAAPNQTALFTRFGYAIESVLICILKC